MADEQKPPVAIRVTRPYATEAEFLEREFDTLTRTSVVLLGAQVRPQGVVLRFEIVLQGGESILRGEGRVVGHKENAHGGESGLTLRFTRLDSRSKTLVDRASALREARARGSASMAPAPPPVPAPEPTPPPPGSRRTGPPPLPESVRAEAIEPPPAADIETTQVDAHFERAAPPPPEPPPSPPRAKADRPSPRKSPPATKPAPPRPAKPATGRGDTPIDRPGDRDGLLTRLRTRAEALPSARVQEILAKRAP